MTAIASKPIKISWKRDTKYSLISGDGRFFIITGSNKPITKCILYIGNKKVRRGDFDNVGMAERYIIKYILRKEKDLEIKSA